MNPPAVPFYDLSKVNARQRDELLAAFTRVLDSGWFVMGAEGKAFEEEYADFVGCRHCIGMGNGLDALTMILRGYRELGLVRDGDEVIVPANTFIASVLAITECRLKPVLVEPDPRTFCLDPALIERAITPRTRVVMPVHLYGQAADMTRIGEVAARHGLKVVEDAAQSQGARHEGRVTGSLGDAAGVSFYPGKNLGALGDEERRQVARRYHEGIRHPLIELPARPDDSARHVWHLFVVRTKRRDELQRHLDSHGVQTIIHYPIPPHQQKAYAGLAHPSLPLTEAIHREVLSLPMSPVMTAAQIERVIEVVNAFPSAA
jgi:dTDP-4-amino-4,6-dideoxygalactose transaminase